MNHYEEAGSDSRAGEYRVFGPPGCGKTTWIKRQVDHAAERFGAATVLVTSFSKAAAAELVGRGMAIPAYMIGTLHAHCLRALGNPKVAELYVAEWNLAYPHWAIAPKSEDSVNHLDPSESASESGDALLKEVGRLRGLLPPEEARNLILRKPELREFYKAWEAYKNDTNLIDFTDSIQVALENMPFAPHNPMVMFVDEAQDLNPMQLRLIRRWGSNCRYFILAGDDDQLIYSHLGCAPEGLLDPPLDPGHIIILKQSHRVPGAIQSFSQEWISNVSRRQVKEYLPRAEAGGVYFEPLSYHDLTGFERWLRITGKETWMILATCNKFLVPVVRWLRDEGVPFHNPYRRKDGSWNPLTHRPGGARNRLLGLLEAHPSRGGRNWTLEQFWHLVEWMRVKDAGLNHGAKKYIAALAKANPNDEAAAELLVQVFEKDTLDALVVALEQPGLGPLIEWWRDRLLTEQFRRITFPMRVVLKHGPLALEETPRVVVGTIHSVKGGEADHVLLFPDISIPAATGMLNQEGLDAVLRQFYVGMTRARLTLHLAEPREKTCVYWKPMYYKRTHRVETAQVGCA